MTTLSRNDRSAVTVENGVWRACGSGVASAPQDSKGGGRGGTPRPHQAIPRVALRWPEEVAAAIGVSDDFLRDHGLVRFFPVWRVGSVRFVALADVERVIQERAQLALDDDDATG